MKLERLSTNKIKFSITFDELSDKGFLQDELWKESLIWHELFDEMLEEAKNVYDLEMAGAVSVEIYSLTSKEIVLILTLDALDEDYYEEWSEEDDEYEDEEDAEIDEDSAVTYIFKSIDAVVLLAQRLSSSPAFNSSLYCVENDYYLIFEKINDSSLDRIEALSEEYGSLANRTMHYVMEYGKLLIQNQAIQILNTHFT
ncbi:adaptor protein MecA [Falsibacillus albus]|nr:adaptor protein MecA [Falsibacillus albus]